MSRFDSIPKWLAATIAVALLHLSAASAAAVGPMLKHELQVRLDPRQHLLAATDRISVTNHKAGRIVFELADHLKVHSVTLDSKPADYQFRGGLLSIALTGGASSHELQIEYGGVFNDQAPQQPINTDNPGFGVTGTIGDRGTLLLAGANWYPYNLQAISIYTLTVDAPQGISAVTSGNNLGHQTVNGRTISRWQIDQPLRGISLAAGAFQPETRAFGRVTAATYFTPALEALSQNYLEATGRYLAMYEKLFGPYAFAQFSVVENFFPTGYGFPAYTLLGQRVLRLPFIIHTSLGHEIAHCWWGNGVLVDTSLGNWSEGLTSYVADHYYKELRGNGVSHRRQWLRNFTSLVPEKQEFALTHFMSRSDPLSKAIGYDRAAMVFHMLRRRVGDDRFWQTLRDVYAQYRFQAISWRHWQAAFERTAGESLERFFEQWVHGTGAPQLSLSDTRVTAKDDGYIVNGILNQRKPYFDVEVDVVLQTGAQEVSRRIALSGGQAEFSIATSAEPAELVVDPHVHLLRRLSPQELPAAVNTIKGADALTVVVSRNLDKRWLLIARRLCVALGIKDADIIHESKLSARRGPDTHVVWLGMPGDASRLPPASGRLAFDDRQITVLNQAYARHSTSFFGLFKNPRRPGRAIGLFLPQSYVLAEELCVKIPHYGKYSYLVFTGSRNQAKGTWPVENSPVIARWSAADLPPQ